MVRRTPPLPTTTQEPWLWSGAASKDVMRNFNRNGRLSQLLDAEAAKVNLPTFAKSDDFSARGLIEIQLQHPSPEHGQFHLPCRGVRRHLCDLDLELLVLLLQRQTLQGRLGAGRLDPGVGGFVARVDPG